MRFDGKFLVLGLLSLLLMSSTVFAAHETAGREPALIWAFGAIRASAANPRVEQVGPQIALSSGDKLKIMIQMRKKCFIYVIHKDAQGNLTMLFPYNVKQFETDYTTGRKYYAPKGDAWFQLDGRTGRETFSLVISDQRLLDLEFLYEKYVSAAPAGKQELAAQMVSELDTIRRFTSTGGVETLASNETLQRGFERAAGADPTDIAQLAREITFEGSYSETFVIDHK